jgi:uncharacterized protein
MAKYRPQSLRTICAALAVWLIAAVTTTGTAITGPLEDAWTSYERGDYATAMRLFRPLAEDGDAIAQYYLGELYDKGRSIPQDYGEAIKWYRRSGEQCSPLASSLSV